MHVGIMDRDVVVAYADVAIRGSKEEMEVHDLTSFGVT